MKTYACLVVATRDIQRPLASAFSRKKAACRNHGEQEPRAFCFPTRNVAQASHSRSGAFLKRVDAKPYRKRVEAYSAAMTPAQGVCVGQVMGCHS